MQENWIGKSRGLQFSFERTDGADPITVYTTRPDTLMGASFVGISPDHPISKELEEGNPNSPPSSLNAARVAPPRKPSRPPKSSAMTRASR